MKNEIDFEMHSLCAISIINTLSPYIKRMESRSRSIEVISSAMIMTLMYCPIQQLKRLNGDFLLFFFVCTCKNSL